MTRKRPRNPPSADETAVRRARWAYVIAAAGLLAGAAPAPLAAETFLTIAPVFQHRRCTNCHVAADVARQSETGRVHVPAARRGTDDRGTIGLRCVTCHQAENHEATGTPGAADWRLAPKAMGWNGLTPGEICRAIVDRARKGGRSVVEIAEHLARDPLVEWAWSPGGMRTPPPMTRQDFLAGLRDLARAGGPCP